MSAVDWSRREVEAIVADYFAMLACELSGTPYNKAARCRALKTRLDNRSEQSIEFKHCNISAALLDADFPYISGYKRRSNYQALLAEVVAARLEADQALQAIAAADVERPVVVPEVDHILAALTEAPRSFAAPVEARDHVPAAGIRAATDFLEREARNRSLGDAGERFVLNFERARPIGAGREALAAKVEHVASTRGDHLGFDVLSFEHSGAERLIEVKTTKYGGDTPFFVTRNEMETSDRHALQYQVYRLYSFIAKPRLYMLPGPIGATCRLSAQTFLATPK